MSVEWQFLVALNEQLRPLKDPVAIQDVAVRQLGEHLHASRVHHARIEGDGFVISRSCTDGVPPFPARGPVARLGTVIVDAWRRGETVAVDDIATDARFTDAERGQLLADQTAAFVGAPLNKLEHRTRQLSQMAWDLTLAEHHAREEIARTLHDGLQQLLVIVALNLEQQLKRDHEAGATASELLTEAKQQLDEALAVARSLNAELFPPVLQRSGLPAALTWLASWTRDKYKVKVEIGADPRADSPRKDIRTLLFESVRELLFNAIKHAHTDRVALALALDAADRPLRPDVILTDVAMPHMDGVEATARLRKELPHIRILGLSMMARNETADAIESAGAAGFFVKGTDTQRLVDRLLALHAARGTGDRTRP